MTNSQNTQNERVVEGEYVARENETQKQGAKSYREQMENINNSDFDSASVDSVSKEHIGEYHEENELSLEQFRERYDDLISQNNNLSSTIAENISMMDIDEKSADMVAQTIHEIEIACNKKTIGERVTSMLPAPVQKVANKMRNDAKVTMHKNRSVAELAQRHFEALSEKRDNLSNSLTSIYQIRDKLETSSSELGKMEQLLIGRMERNQSKMHESGNAAKARIEQLKSKEMVVQVQSQFLTQRDLAHQIDAVQYVAEQLVDSINAALPSIRSNFIDQVSITAGLKQMKDLKESVDKTREMTITLQERSFEDTRSIMTSISKDGVGYNEKDMARIEKLNAEKQKFQKDLANDFAKSDQAKDKQIQRLRNLIVNQNSVFEESALKGLENSAKERDNKNQ